MGCDIHICLERQRTINNVKQWVNIDNFQCNPYFDGTNEEKEWTHKPFYGDRDYELFAILAGVRNYNEITPISEPKGLPADISNLTKKLSDGWEGDGHSHSYLTLAELLTADHFVSEDGHKGFKAFVEKFKTIARDEVRYWLNDDVRQHSNNFRIVFWFDN